MRQEFSNPCKSSLKSAYSQFMPYHDTVSLANKLFSAFFSPATKGSASLIFLERARAAYHRQETGESP